MQTIRQLAMQWWEHIYDASERFEWKFKMALKYKLEKNIYSLTDEEIENIFYNEVIVKWWEKFGSLALREKYPRHTIKEIYLKEHSKEEPITALCEDGSKLTFDELGNLQSVQPPSVNKDVEVDEETLESKVRNLFSPIKNYIAVTRQLLSDNEDTELVKLAQEEGLRADQNIYAIISEVHNASQPKVEDNSWDEVFDLYVKECEKYKSGATLATNLFHFLKQHYTLIKK